MTNNELKAITVPLLKAAHHNWGLIKAGDWESTEWTIFTDGTYSQKTYYIKTPEENKNALQAELYDPYNISEINRKMSTRAFSKLLDAINTDPWRPDGEVIDAYDGDAWEFHQFDVAGNVVRDSGKLGYIYGNAVLERIASLLP